MTNKKPSEQESISAFIVPELWDLAPRYVNHIKGEIQKMQQLAQSGDYGAIARMAHNIKGSAGTYGMGDLSKTSQSLLEAAKIANEVSVEALLNQMSFYLSHVQFFLDDTA